MRPRDRFTPVLVLLVIFVCSVSAKYQNYSRVLESPGFTKAMALLTPEELLTKYMEKIKLYADDEIWKNSQCNQDLLIVQAAVMQRQMWALKMFDASSKLQSGLLQGNIVDLGQYDECMTISRVDESLPGPNIRGRHCMYSVNVTYEDVTIPITPTQSICLPSSCSADDFKIIFNETISKIDLLEGLTIDIVSSTCTPVDPVIWNFELILCVTILAIYIGFLIVCTIVEILSHRYLNTDIERQSFVNSLAMFSLRKNAAAILDMNLKKGSIPELCGIRFLSMTWVVIGHEYMTYAYIYPIVNPMDVIKWFNSWSSLYYLQISFAVDSFFAMSGFLMTYLFLKHTPKQKSFNIPMYYLHRYIRLTPALIAIIAFTSIIIPKLGSGARWKTSMDVFAGPCRTNWWQPLLYVQNFVSEEEMCLKHLWYLAVDMQLFWISPIILYPLHKKPKLGLLILTGFFLASLAIPATIIGVRQLRTMSYFCNYPVNLFPEIFVTTYSIPYHRAGPWLVGIFLGYDLATHDRRLSKGTVAVGWALTIAAIAFCVIGSRSFSVAEYEYDVVWETSFSAVSGPIWAVAVCWIIYACMKNHAGPLSTFLSSRIFFPLSKLSYCVYIVHMVIQTIKAAGLRTSDYFSDYSVGSSFFSSLIISFLIAFVFNLVFEAPMMALEKLMFSTKRESQSESRKELKPSKDEESQAEKSEEKAQ